MIFTVMVVLGLIAAIATQIKTGETGVAVMVMLCVVVLQVGLSLSNPEAGSSGTQSFDLVSNSGR